MGELNMTDALTLQDTETLRACEAVIKTGLHCFREVGEALLTIRDTRLYRASHSSFEAYCRERWGMGKSYAHQIIKSAKAVGDLVAEVSAIADTLPESAARELAKVEPERRAEVVEKVAASGKVTAKSIKAAAGEDEAAPAMPEDAETRAVRLSLKAKAVAAEFKDYLAAINPTREEMIQAACAFRKLANELDRAAAQLKD